jgi:FMN reductase [NAD(P)H]
VVRHQLNEIKGVLVEFAEVLRGRRMVRNYRPDPVDGEVLRRIVRVVRRAPSAGFSQGHRVVVVTDAAVRKAIADVAEGWYLDRGYHPWISTAPAHLVLGIRERSYHERYQEADKVDDDGAEIPWPVPFWWFDAGALFMLLQLAAVDEGLATGFFSPAEPDELAAIGSLVGFPDDVAVVGAMTIGHAADDPAVPVDRLAKRRKPMDDLVRWLPG